MYSDDIYRVGTGSKIAHLCPGTKKRILYGSAGTMCHMWQGDATLALIGQCGIRLWAFGRVGEDVRVRHPYLQCWEIFIALTYTNSP